MTELPRQHRELALRKAVLAGDEAAWRCWYDETFEAVQRFVAWRLRGQPDGCDEILQETWLITVRRIQAFDPQRGPFVDWVRGIAAHVLKNHLRKRHASAGAQPIDQFPRQILAPMMDASRSQHIVETLQFLPERYADVLREKYLEQRSVLEIANKWNESAKAIESLLTRARQAFREAFGTDQDEI